MKIIELRNNLMDKIIELTHFKEMCKDNCLAIKQTHDALPSDKNVPQLEKMRQDMNKLLYLQKEASHLISILRMNFNDPTEIGFKPDLFEQVEALKKAAL